MKYFKYVISAGIVMLAFANLMCVKIIDCTCAYEEVSQKPKPVEVTIGVSMGSGDNGVIVCDVLQKTKNATQDGTLSVDKQELIVCMSADFDLQQSEQMVFAVTFKNTTQNNVVLSEVWSDEVTVSCDGVSGFIEPMQTVCCDVVVLSGGVGTITFDFDKC